MKAWFVIAIVALASGPALAQEQLVPPKDVPVAEVPASILKASYSQTFKGKPADLQMYELRGKKEGVQFLKYEPDGLRIALPRGYRGDNIGTGLSYHASVAGDFEITLSFEMLKATKADVTNNGVKVRLGVYLDGQPDGDGTAVGENIASNGKKQFSTFLSNVYEDVGKPLDTQEIKGQLRLMRVGSDLFCYGARGDKNEFTLLKKHPYGPEAVNNVFFSVRNDDPKPGVDVRITELRIRADAIKAEKPAAPAVIQAPKSPATAKKPKPVEMDVNDLAALRKEYAREYVQAFKGKPADMHMFDLRGKFEGADYLQYEPNGVRVTWPAGYKGGSLGTGLSYRGPVSGDYEITLRFEILNEGKGKNINNGTKVALGGYLDIEPDKSGGAVTQIMLNNGKVQYSTYLLIPNEPKVNGQRLGDFQPTAEKVGRLRLVRSGSLLYCFGAQGDENDFTLLKIHPFSAEKLKGVFFAARNDNQQPSLDVRFTELRIRADKIGEETVATAPSTKKGMSLFLLLGLAITFAIVLAVWYFQRYRRRKS
jgi:hypothetical protein